jgi:NADPH-dependent curcumin reductase CurA
LKVIQKSVSGNTSGLRVVGSAGDDKKVTYLLEELGFDGAFNYKKEKPSDALPRLCPDGIGTDAEEQC